MKRPLITFIWDDEDNRVSQEIDVANLTDFFSDPLCDVQAECEGFKGLMKWAIEDIVSGFDGRVE